METVDEEFLAATIDFIGPCPCGTRSRSSPGSTRAECISGPGSKPESQGKTGLGVYPDGMVEHDGQVGQLLAKLDELGIADNTIVIYTTDNGAETFSWPDGGTTPFRGEKNTNWEGGYSVPAMVRWPGLVRPRTEINDIFSARGLGADTGGRRRRARIKAKLLQGHTVGDKTFKVHLDGYDQRALLAGNGPDPRREFFYWTDDGDLAGLRFDQYKVGVPGAAGARAGSLDAAVRPLARAETVQSAVRSVRARRARSWRL